MFSFILFILAIVFESCEAKEVDNLANMLELAAANFMGNDQMGEFSNLNRDEALATILEDQVYTIYEHKRENPKATANRVKYRIKSAGDTMPSSCTQTGNPGTRLVCPTPKNGTRYWTCILPSELCNGIADCENGEDEDPKFCMFYKAAQKNTKNIKKSKDQQLDCKEAKSRNWKHKMVNKL
uniref:Uncharacterized protein n=1 Tax=Acrobeloides nanus TaxID=290746 RepID=A0A914CVT7_9BILA